MKKLLIAAAVSAFASASWAKDVPALGSVLGDLTGEEMSSFEESLVGAANLNSDIEMAFSAEALELAISEGIISEEDAQDVGKALDIIEANAEYFDVDFNDFLLESLNNGDVSLEEVTATLAAFDGLSEAGKAIMGPGGSGDTSLLSAEDLAIVNEIDEQYGNTE